LDDLFVQVEQDLLFLVSSRQSTPKLKSKQTIREKNLCSKRLVTHGFQFQNSTMQMETFYMKEKAFFPE